jgi:hypothetical protein
MRASCEVMRERCRRSITVDYATSNLTAVAGQDYQAVLGTLTFDQNETVKTIIIPICGMAWSRIIRDSR